jgi:putative transcriptional regulator
MVEGIEAKDIIKTIRAATGLSQRAFAQRYAIPVRTVENWEGGQNVPPLYLVGLLWRVVFELDFVDKLPDIDSRL